MDDTLSIGDIVCLYSEERSGYMYSSQTSNYYNEVAVGHNQHRIRPPVADQHIIAFEICAANRYKLTKKYHKLKVQSETDPDNLRLKNTVAQAKIAADAEGEDNDLEQKRNQGKKVLYGHTVQLRHLFTKKYVHVSTTKTSRTESNNMAVELQGENAKHAQFRIMPRYKVKAEGDVVQVHDQIVLESVKSTGQFLHVGQTLFGQQSVYHHSFELNLSVRQSGFTLYRKYKPTADDVNKIKVGDPMRFYHKEMEAYLVAEGLFDDELTEDVHLRLRPVDPNRPKTLFPSSSAVTFWQIELEDGPVSGGILKWEQQCRIVHMCTRRYLAVSTSGGVSLSTDNNDPSTVFRLHAVIRDSDDIAFEAYARIEHVLTGFWLHALADEYMKRQENGSDDDKSMSGLKYTTAQLKKVTAIKEKQYDDAFTLQFVEPELVGIFHYMAGMVPFIQKLVSDKKSGAVLNAKVAHDVIASLQEMEDFMVENSVPSKNRQKLMRNLRIVELLVSLLRVPYQGSPDQSHLTNIFVEAYNVLYTYLMGNSRKNELYIAKYIDFFLTQFEYKSGKIGLNAAHMVMELIRDNRKIVDRISHDHINKFVDLLQREKNYRYLELLSVLCVCDGVSIADNQTYITEAWLMRDNKKQDKKAKKKKKKKEKKAKKKKRKKNDDIKEVDEDALFGEESGFGVSASENRYWDTQTEDEGKYGDETTEDEGRLMGAGAYRGEEQNNYEMDLTTGRTTDRSERTTDRSERATDRSERTIDRSERTTDRSERTTDSYEMDLATGKTTDRTTDRSERTTDRNERTTDRSERTTDRSDKTTERNDNEELSQEKKERRERRAREKAERSDNEELSQEKKERRERRAREKAERRKEKEERRERRRKRRERKERKRREASETETDYSKCDSTDHEAIELVRPRPSNCVYLTDVGDKIGKSPGVVYVSTNNGRIWKELKTFASTTSEEDEGYMFLERQLELFGMLCHGQNEFAIKVITKQLDYLTWTEAFTCLCDNSLPDRLRAKYCELIITLFVDIGDNVSVVDRVKLSYTYDEIDTSEDKVDRSTSQTYQYFPALRDWISLFLGTNGDMTGSQIGNNMLVEQVLRLVHYLVKYGFYYKSTDIKMLLEPLMSLLDGRNDKPYPNMAGKEAEEVLRYFRRTGRFQKSPETKAIVDAKIQALEVLSLFFNFIFNLRMEKFMNMFKETHSQASLPNMSPPELGPMLGDTFVIVQFPSLCKTALRKLQGIFTETAFFGSYQTTEILMDLSHYDYDEMVRKSMQLLNRYYSSHRTLFTRAVQAQVLITDASVAVSEKLNNLLPALRRLSTAKLTNEQAEELGRILDQLIALCHLDGELEEQHNMNQSILYNHAVLEDAFVILSQNIDVKLLEQYGGLRKVFQKTFLLLRAMARGNLVVQGRLFDRLDMLLSKEGAAAELAECLTEVFTGNSNTCMKVMGHQVQKVMSLVAQHRENIPQFLDLLNAIVKVEELDLPLKRNQSFVMTYFMQYRADIATVIDRPEQERELILTGKESKELDYLIAMVDLLATCAEGENRYIESICQTIFKISELLKVLNHTSISSNLKRPFLRFFLWVYLNTAGGMIESGAGDLPHDPLLWKYVESLNEDLQRMATFVAANPAKTKQLLKRPPAKRPTNEGPQSERASSQEEEMRGMLHYYFDAVMPFLQIFCRSYYQPDKEAHAGEPIKLSALTLTFEKFMDAIAPLISMERHLKNLVTSMTSLITATGAIPLEKMEEFHSKYGGGTGSQDVRSDVRKSYEDYYNTEEDINSKLNIFSNNMQQAYGGVNNVQTQIGYPSDEEYYQIDGDHIGYPSKKDYSEMGGDEELPLGQEFQDHIKCFVDEKTREPKKKFKMAEKLVKQLEISQSLQGLSEEEKIEQLELDIKCLQLMRGLIHNEIVKLPDEWELTPAASRRQLKLIESVQSALNSYGVVVSSLGHLNRPQDDLVRELLAFLAVLLFNGNENVQESMLEFFTGTREETFFFAVKSRMQLSALAMREKRQLHAMHMAKVEELVAQAKALQKAMKEGKAGAGDVMAAAQFGSMLSDIRKSRISMKKRNTRGSRVSMNRSSMLMPSAQRESKVSTNRNSVLMVQPASMGSGIRGSTLLGVPGMQLNGSSLRMGNEKPPVKAASLRKSQKVAPAEDVPDIKLDEMDEEEIAELTEVAISTSAELEFKDDGYIELVLRVLGLMCDNQHRGLQDYLREQPDNIKSVNLVAETTRFLSILYGNVNGQSAPLIIQLFDTLVEFTSGNFHNQAIVFDNKVCEYVNHILRAGTFKGCSSEQTYSLKKAIVTLVRALCEENPPDTKGDETQSLSGRNVYVDRSSAREVLEYVDSEVLMTTMVQAHHDFLSQKAEYVEVRTLVEDVGFAYHHMLCRKMDLHKTCTKQALVKTEGDEAAWEFFAERTLSIEILKDDVLQRIHFQVKDKNVLREEIKEKFKYSVDRSSPSNKLRDFMAWSTDIIEDIKYQRRIHANPLARFFVQSKWWLNPCVLLVSLILCLIVMVTWKASPARSISAVTNYYSIEPDLSGWSGAQESIYAFGGLHNILSICIVISYFLSNHPAFPDRRDFKELFLKFLPAKKESGGEEEDEDDPVQEKRESHLEVRFFSIMTFYYLAFLACSILGTIFWGYFFSFHLLHVVLLNQLLQRVILAVTRNGVSLVLVGILGMAIIFMFALVAFAFFRAYLDNDNGRQCETMYQCFVTVVHHGFVEGMYTTFEQQLANRSFVTTISLAAFDFIFFILITTIGLNIIFGIIVDTFSELRDSKWQIDNDMKNNCFICSRESYDFEKQAAGFESHVKHEHNQWAYLFFFIHLDETRPNDYSALELHVHRLLKSNNQDFFPLNRALSLDAEEDSSERKLETLMSQVEYLVAKMKEEEAEKEREKEKQRQQEWETKHKLASK